MSRVAVDMAGSSLVLKADSSYTFADFKVEEYARSFMEGIEGYEGSKWEKLGVEWYEEGEYGADDEASEEGVGIEKGEDGIGRAEKESEDKFDEDKFERENRNGYPWPDRGTWQK